MENALQKDSRPNGRGEQTRDRILDAAEELFANLGFAAARLEDVALAVGIRRASIVYYFRNKQELYEATEARIFAALQDECERQLAGKNGPLERLLAIADAWLNFMVARPSAARLILRNCADVYPGGTDPVQFSQSALHIWEHALAEGIDEGALQPVPATMLLHIIGGGILQYASTGHLLGESRRYQPDNPATLEHFRDMLHTTIRALLRAM